MMRILRSDSGFSLLEAMIAMAILVIGILAVYSMQLKAAGSNANSNRVTDASVWNSNEIERIMDINFTDPSLNDTDGDGTAQDGNNDGVDDNGGDFGLDDATNLTADNITNSPDNRYTMFWNVAVGVPMPNLKTVRLLVRDNNQLIARPIAYTFIKR